MKHFRTTKSNVIISLLVAFAVLAFVIYFALSVHAANPFRLISENILGGIDLGLPVRIEAKSVDRAIFNRIVLRDISITERSSGRVIATASSLSAGLPIQSIILSLFGESERYEIVLADLSINASLSDMTSLIAAIENMPDDDENTTVSGDSDGGGEILDSIDNSSFSLLITGAPSTFALDGGILTLSSFRISAALDPGFKFKGAEVDLGELAATLDNERDVIGNMFFNLHEDMSLSADIRDISLSYKGSSASLSSLKITTNPLRDFSNIDADLELSTLNLLVNGITAKVDPSRISVSRRPALITATFSSGEKIEVAYSDYRLTIEDYSLMADYKDSNVITGELSLRDVGFTGEGLPEMGIEGLSLSGVYTRSSSTVSDVSLSADLLDATFSDGFALRLPNIHAEGDYTIPDGNADLTLTSTLEAATLNEALGTLRSEFSAKALLENGTPSLSADLFRVRAENLPDQVNLHLDADLNRVAATINSRNESILASFDFDLGDLSYRLSLDLISFRPMPYVSMFASGVSEALLNDESAISGNLSSTGRVLRDENLTIPLSLSADLNLSFNGLTPIQGILDDLSLSFSGTLENDVMSAGSLALSAAGYSLRYTGSYDISELLPVGNLWFAADATPNRRIFNVLFTETETALYSFDVTSDLNESLLLTGDVSFQSSENVNATGSLSVGSMVYPLTMDYAIPDALLRFYSSEGILLEATLSNPVSVNLSLTNLRLPDLGGGLGASNITTSFSFRRDMEEDGFTLSVAPFRWYSDTWSFYFRAEGGSNGFEIHDFNIHFDGFEDLRGNIFLRPDENGAYSLPGLSFGLSVQETEGDEHWYISLAPHLSEEGFIIDIQNFKPSRFPFISTSLDDISVSLYGATDTVNTFRANGFINAMDREGLNLGADIEIDEYNIRVSDGALAAGNARLDNINASFNLERGDTHLEAGGSFLMHHLDRDVVFRGSAAFDGALGAVTGNLLSLPSYFAGLLENGASGELRLTGISLNDEFFVPDETYSVVYTGERFSIDSNLFHAAYDLSSSHFEVDIDESWLFPLRASGTVTGERLDINVDYVSYPFEFTNLFMIRPIVIFGEGHIAGSLRIVGDPLDPQFYGTLISDKLWVWNLWTENEIINLKNATITAYGNYFTMPYTDIWAENQISGRISNGKFRGDFVLSEWNVPSWNLEFLVSPEEPVAGSLPLAQQNLQADAENVSGYLKIEGFYSRVNILGDVTVASGMVTTPARLPSWHVSTPGVRDMTGVDVIIRSGDNVQFVYPNQENPIISLILDTGEQFHLYYQGSTGTFIGDGTLDLIGGEIFYFQRNFFIEEGTVTLRPEDLLQGRGAIDPTISLRARLRDYDLSGNRTDIYLVLQNATLADINPRFESSTGLSQEEILQVLGHSILPTNAYEGMNVASIASMATVALDVWGRIGGGLGLLGGTSSVTNTIRDTLGLDIFTLRSRIFQNLIVDAIPSQANRSLTPVARYLDGTSLFVGKFFGSDFFLQGSLHFTASQSGGTQPTRTQAHLLSDDLDVEIELALDWDNPLAVFNIFTQPTELSLLGFLDNIGISVSKRMTF